MSGNIIDDETREEETGVSLSAEKKKIELNDMTIEDENSWLEHLKGKGETINTDEWELIDVTEVTDADEELHITNFEWNTILEVADIIKERIPCKVTPSTDIDTVQLNKRNEPDPYILNFWKPKISLKDGINKIINEMI